MEIAENNEVFVDCQKKKSLAEVARITVSAVERSRFDHLISLAPEIAKVLKKCRLKICFR